MPVDCRAPHHCEWSRMMSENILSLAEYQSAEQTPVPLIDLVEQYESIKPEIQAAVTDVFDTQRFVLGEEVAQFECEISEYCDSREAIGCASGTDALLLSLMALDVGPGDEVITSPFTFFATAGSICRLGAVPVFVDIEPESFNLDPSKVEAAITDRTKAIMPVHIFGQCCEMEPLWRIAVTHKVAIIEDAAQAIGASYQGRRAGVLGNVGCFSFFPTKNLGGAGDGGIITTDDKDLAARLRRLRVHGDRGGYTHLEVGINSRLDALQAAVLRVKLRHLDAWHEARRENAERYAEMFHAHGLNERMTAPITQPAREHVYNQYCLRIPHGHRDAVLQYLRDRQVGCGVYYPKPLHLQDCFSDLGYEPGCLPESERAAEEALALPIYPELGAARQKIVVDTLSAAMDAVEHQTGGRLRRAA